MKKRIKRTFSIHHWMGLVVGIFLLIASITGSVLVFHSEIDHIQFASLSTLEKPASKLIMDKSFEHIRTLHPNSDIRVPEFPEDLSQALKYEIRKDNTRKWIFTHPETGEVLGTVERADQRLVHILLDLHYNLLSGTPGKMIVLLGGIGLIIMSITGFMLYRKSIVKVIAFRQRISLKNRRSLFSGLHRIIGVWSLVFNLLISITGSWIAYTIVESALAPASTANYEPSSPNNISIDAGFKQIRNEYPEFDIKYLRFSNEKLFVLGRLDSDPLIFGRTASKIEINMSTGKIDKVSFLKDAPWHQQVITLFKPLHFGNFGGLVIKICYSFFGILPGVLAISGFLVWRSRKIAKPLKQKKRILPKPLVHSSTV